MLQAEPAPAARTLGRYELLMPVASGGMGTVWAARLRGKRGFEKLFAVKTMLSRLSTDPQFEKMFLAEASLASRVRHPHVVEVLDLGEENAILFQVMEWIDGLPLSQIMKHAARTGGLPLPLSLRIVLQAAAGLHAAHELRDERKQLVGLVHRDVSPQNILVSFDGIAKVVDFGIAKATALADAPTDAGMLKGKVAYMAPEQVRAAPLDRRADLFALATILYTLGTGRHPFRKDNEAATIHELCSPGAIVPARRVRPDFPEALEAVLATALEKDPQRRFPTCNDFLRALDRAAPIDARCTDEDVANYMRRMFGGEREARHQKLTMALAQAASAVSSPATTQDLADVIAGQPATSTADTGSSGVAAPPIHTDSLVQSVQFPSLAPAPPARRTALFALIGVASALAIALLIAVVALVQRRAVAASPPSVEPVAATLEPPPAAAVETAPTAVPAEVPSAAADAAAPASAAPVELTTVPQAAQPPVTVAKPQPAAGKVGAKPAPVAPATKPAGKPGGWENEPGF